MLRDELLFSYKYTSGKCICDNRSINYCNESVNTNETPLRQNQYTEKNLTNDCIDVNTILKEINDSLTRNYDVLETILMTCCIITFNVTQQMKQTVGCMIQSNS